VISTQDSERLGGSVVSTTEAAPNRGEQEPLRLLQVINRIWMGGTEYALLNMTSGMRAELFEHRFCSLRGCDPEFPRRSMIDGKVFFAGENNGRFQFPIFRLARIMRQYRPHIVHSRNWGAIEAVFAARLAKVPVVIHSEHGYELEMLKGLPRRQRLMRRAAYAFCDAIFTVTQELRDFHARQAGISAKRIRVIHNGVDTKRFSPGSNLCLREQFNIPQHRLVIGTVARMVPIKNHRTLLQAAELLMAKGVDAHFLLAGGGPLLESYQAYVRNSKALADRVVFLGRTENVPDVLRAMDVFVLPSTSEGMSNTILEAMASGLPVVATRVGGNGEVVQEGQTGWLFPPGDSEKLAGLVEDLLLNRERLRAAGRAGRDRVLTHFGLEGMVANYESLYLELARRSGLKV
jgi:sugar transferase (PEP-CTERM/EpsH1 system associated)